MEFLFPLCRNIGELNILPIQLADAWKLQDTSWSLDTTSPPPAPSKAIRKEHFTSLTKEFGTVGKCFTSFFHSNSSFWAVLTRPCSGFGSSLPKAGQKNFSYITFARHSSILQPVSFHHITQSSNLLSSIFSPSYFIKFSPWLSLSLWESLQIFKIISNL